MRVKFVAPLMALLLSATAHAGCFDTVQVGEPGFVVIEKCGQPQRREREERPATKRVEMVRGTERASVKPLQPQVLESWYYDTSLNTATVIHLEDGGVTHKERLIREE